MSIRISVGLTKESGSPNYGSVGVKCAIEYDLDASIAGDDAAVVKRTCELYALAGQATRDALDQREVMCLAPGPAINDDHRSPSNGSTGYRASTKQLQYARQLAKQVPELGVRQLDALAKHVFAKPLIELSSVECSAIIDLVKDFKAGRLEVPASLNGATS